MLVKKLISTESVVVVESDLFIYFIWHFSCLKRGFLYIYISLDLGGVWTDCIQYKVCFQGFDCLDVSAHEVNKGEILQFNVIQKSYYSEACNVQPLSMYNVPCIIYKSFQGCSIMVNTWRKDEIISYYNIWDYTHIKGKQLLDICFRLSVLPSLLFRTE